ncbi:MAG: AsmA family protein [Deltaproteobacteria bacterium]|nr:AsmA family protein [Deltaproteobacteria bacterium]MBW2137410.1 AsmA family protein [Deltaproteobacteria bacterium]
MKKAARWIGILLGGLVVLVILALVIIPRFIDIQDYKPRIEKKVAEATGRPFRLGGDMELSLFPWAGVSLSDLHLGNPEGFKERDFLEIQSFEVRVKLIPLIFKDIQVKRFLLTGARVALERRGDGRTSWEGLGRHEGEIGAGERREKEEPSKAGPGKGLPIKALAVGDFTIKDGTILWIDDVKGGRKEISDITLTLKDVSLERPFRLSFSAKMDGQPVSLEGVLGPLGREPGKGDFPLDLAMKALDKLDLRVKGKIVNPAVAPGIDVDLEIAPFSPRELAESLGTKLPLSTADPGALKSVSLKAKLKGGRGEISISEGTLVVDQSRLAFLLRAKEMEKPNIAFDLNLDQIDLDRYLPPNKEKKKGAGKGTEGRNREGKKKKVDYGPLRRLILDGTIYAGKLKVKDIRAEKIKLKIRGRNGVFRLDPLDLNLYGGAMNVVGKFNFQGKSPVSETTLHAEGIKAGAFLKDFIEKDIIEGTLKADLGIRMVGDDPERIKGSLNGKGNLLFKDGAVVGIDLAGMARNVKSAFGLGEQAAEKPKTDFTELTMPFTITDGVVKTSDTRLMGPLLRVLAKGRADLVKETLDFRVEPRFVGTLKGQGDIVDRKGITVPVLVSGTFSRPTFRPDLRGVMEKELKKRLGPAELLEGQGEQQAPLKELEEKAKGFLKGLPFGK